MLLCFLKLRRGHTGVACRLHRTAAMVAYLTWSQVDEHALQRTELSEEGRGITWTLEQGPKEREEDMNVVI